MNTPNETPEQNSNDKAARKGKPNRTERAAFWLRMIDVRKHKLTHEYRKSLHHTAREGISDEEYSAMLGTLEKMARNLGWDESQKDERPFGRGHRHPAMMGFGAGHHGFGHGHDDEHDGDHHHEHRYPGAKRGFRRMHPNDHGHRPGTVATDPPQA